MKNLKAKTEKHPERKVPQRIFDIKTKIKGTDPLKIARAVLKSIASDIKIKADLSQLRFEEIRRSILGTHVLFQQQINGKPISGAWIRVDIDKNNHVYNIQNDLIPSNLISKGEGGKVNKSPAKSDGDIAAGISEEEAQKIALAEFKSQKKYSFNVIESESCYYPVKGIPASAWKIVLYSKKPAAEWKVYVSSANGSILSKCNLLKAKSVTGYGLVFDPNPVVVLNDPELEDNSKIPDSAYAKVELRDLAGNGFLDGPFVSTSATDNRVKNSEHSFLLKRGMKGFKEVMVYFHIDRVQRYIQKLGFDNILNNPIKVDVNGQDDDNSFYSPKTKSLSFGTGGVDDAEDAEIILHEYGHAIQDNQVPGFGEEPETRAMGEGFGDYLAASFFSDKKSTALKPTIGSWDAVAYSGAEPPCLRRLDSNKKYPKDITGEEHNDGEIWSAALWEIRAALNRTVADKLIIAHHFLLTRFSKFEDAANALIAADKNLNGGKNGKAILNVFVKNGILKNPKRKNRQAGINFQKT